MKTYGYARISTPRQSIERQIRNILRDVPNAVIYEEVYTGTKVAGRKKWAALMKIIMPGDTIIFDSVSRMSRDAEDGFELYQELYAKGITLVFLKEPHINTEVFKQALTNQIEMTGTNADIILEAVNRYLLVIAKEQIRLAFEQSEKEVTDLRERTKEGLQTAKLKGKQVGRVQGQGFETKKSVKVKADIQKMAKTFGGKMNDTECIRLLGISRHTYYKYKRELIEQMEE